MKKLDNYLDLCTQVYDLSKPKPPEDEYDFYKTYVRSTKDLILEPMCGTGRFLLPFLKEGFNVCGFDASENMLNALHEKAKSLNLKPKVWQGFLENLNQPDQYGLIFIPSGSFGLVVDLDLAQIVLKTFYNHLKHDGVLVFEAETIKSIPNQFGIWKASVYSREDGKMIIANFLDLHPIDNVSFSIAKYELVDSNHIVQTEIENFRVRYYEPKQIIGMLKNAGFSNIRMLKAFRQSQNIDHNDKAIVYECRK